MSAALQLALDGSCTPLGGAVRPRPLSTNEYSVHKFRKAQKIRERRDRNEKLRETMQAVTVRGKSPRGCGRTVLAGGHGALVLRDGVAGFSGFLLCGSIWLCAVCAARVRNRRAEEALGVMSAHRKAGGGVYFGTATLRHTRADTLERTLGLVNEGFTTFLTGGAWHGRARARSFPRKNLGAVQECLSEKLAASRHEVRPGSVEVENTVTETGKERTRVTWWEPGAAERWGIVGHARTIEITWGEANGWHPHVHWVFFTETPLAEEERAGLEEWLFLKWAKAVSKDGRGEPTRENGLDFQEIKNEKDVAKYLTKVQLEDGKTSRVHLEFARADLKRGRAGAHGVKGLTPFELLELAQETGEAEHVARWNEYEIATKGRRCFTWSRGMRARYDIEELEDEQLVLIEEEAEVVEVVHVFVAEEVQLLWLPGARLALMRAAERGGREAVHEVLEGLWELFQAQAAARE